MGWKAAIAEIDEVWVPTAWNKEVWVKDGVPAEKISVVGEGVDSDGQFNPHKITQLDARRRTIPISIRDNYLFLSVFKFEKRKGWEELVTAFVAEFGCDEAVSLVLRTEPDPPDTIKDFIYELETSKNSPIHVTPCSDITMGRAGPPTVSRVPMKRTVTLLPRVPETDYAAMFRSADAHVLFELN